MFAKKTMRTKYLIYCTIVLASVALSSCNKDDNGNGGINTSQKEWLNQNLNYGSVTDIDGNSYATIRIGTQTWMAENLRTTKYCNGDPIPNVIIPYAWGVLTSGAWSHYQNNEQWVEVPYGKLYNWYAVDDSRNICPCGWHVPSDAEWSTLINYLDPNADGGNNFPNTAGGKMKSAGTQYWAHPNSGATNESGFSGLPGGYRYSSFEEINYDGWWWSSTEAISDWTVDVAWSRSLYNDNGGVYRLYYFKRTGLSVRCIRD